MELSWDEIKDALRDVLQEEMGCGDYRIAPRWDGGKLVLKPFDSALQPKEIPLNVFFKKLTSVREKLRVLEQKIKQPRRAVRRGQARNAAVDHPRLRQPHHLQRAVPRRERSVYRYEGPGRLRRRPTPRASSQ